MREKSLINIVKSRGPSIDPCGTPLSMHFVSDISPFNNLIYRPETELIGRHQLKVNNRLKIKGKKLGQKS